MNIEVGADIPLVAQLECPDASILYVKAVVKDSDRIEVTGSPVTLGLESDGLYLDSSLTMPDKQFITATYSVYEDAGLTIKSEDFCTQTVTFNKLIDNTPNKLDLIGIIETDSEIFVTIDQEEIIQATIEESDIEISLESDIIETNISDSNLSGSTE